MKKLYESPELVFFSVLLIDVLTGSTEGTIPEVIVGDGDGNGDDVPIFTDPEL